MDRGKKVRLRQYVAGLPRYFWGVSKTVALTQLATGSIFGKQLCALHGRSILLATRNQLNAALAMIELDGVARRLVICPPDLPFDHIREIAAAAEINALVFDEGTPDPDTLGGPLLVPCGATIEPHPDPHLMALGEPTEWVLLTSGTMGPPKLVSHTVASLIAPIRPGLEAPVWGTFYDIRRYGGMQIFFRAVVGGGSLVLSSPSEPVADHLARLAARGVTHMSGTPSHWWRVLMGQAANLFRPRYVRLSGETAGQALLDNLRTAYPDARLGHAFASTEAGVGFEVDDGLEGFSAELVDADNPEVGIKVEDGTLRLRSRRTASRYVGKDAPALLDKDGFVDTADMVELRGGRYYFVGRKDGVINVGGLKVHPEEIESTINRHAGVSGSLVKARKSPITGAIVVAEVVLKEGERNENSSRLPALEREILELCRRDLAPYKVPAAIRFVATLPMSPAGKLMRHA
jgi:acyl-coenzyme A synthetase/AMP-(fatty) acid ligase